MSLALNLNDQKYLSWAFFGLTALFGIIYWHLYADSVPVLHINNRLLTFEHINGFSEEYFDFVIDKPNGYPIFLFLVRLISQNNVVFVKAVTLFQLVVFLLSAWYLSVQFYYFSNRRSLSFLLLLLILGNPEIIKFCFLIMTESFMMSLLMLILSLNCQWASQTTIQAQSRSLILLSLCLGASILIRPICYAWIMATILVLALFYGRTAYTGTERLRTAALFFIPLLLCWMLNASFHYLKFGSLQKGNFLTNLLLSKVAMTAEQQDLESTHPFIKNIFSLYQPVHTLIRQAKTSKMKYWIGLFYFDGTRQSLPLFNTLYDEENINAQSKQAFVELCIHHPVKYLKDIARNYTALWQFWDLMTPEDIQAFIHFAKTYGPLPAIGPIENLTPIYTLHMKLNTYTTWPPFLLFIRTVMCLIWVVTLYFFGLTLLCLLNKKPSTTPLWAGLLSSSLLQATYLITASVNVGVFRYGIVMWPAIVFVGVTFLFLFLAPQKLSSSRPTVS